MKELSEKYEGNEEIATAYAKGLLDLTSKQDEAEEESATERTE